ncbi:unnamed protein product (macronuclear) [Paramecium tetraurelia]|uniref:P-type ATPase A domain-containing protein n=1 Tax=Paramecium tetraurelia TaxID=5888 RepID=A0BLP7_PARTE|nr:uncharacterized protein GSPATT00030097001 [Paramecium tetraurelia]CAK59464.1 unnamed protein product [Paramecium tetraurelia]|eukprot:XP_001426862.1 hypothetical protein (macronuclear) [Paramecium tetraurelia strain d4-2]
MLIKVFNVEFQIIQFVLVNYLRLMSYPVKNSDVEGQHLLISVAFAQLSKIRLILAILLSLITAFLFALALKYSNKLYTNFLFIQVDDEVSATHYLITTSKNEQFVCPKHLIKEKSYFTFRMLVYGFNSQIQSFEPIEFECKGRIISEMIKLRNKQDRNVKREYFGYCSIQIPIDSILVYSFNAFTGAFNLLQYFAVAIWIAENIILPSILILIFTLLSVYINYFLYVRSRKRLQQLANYEQNVEIYDRDKLKLNQIYQKVPSSWLLPGDLLVLKENQVLNCDCAIIEGDVLVNEATLTGEDIPIPKCAFQNQNVEFSFEKMNQNCLFEGTKLIQVNRGVAIVLRTGFSTLRGQYFRNVLYPHPQSMKFYIQAAKFLLGNGLIMAAIFGFFLISYIPMDFEPSILVLRFLDNIVWSIPPSMPIFFQVCKTFSLVKLEKKGIIGNNAEKIESAGIIDTCCFDKTGTLTTLGFKVVKAIPQEEQPILNAIMGCCHHLLKVNGNIIGDPLEIEMLRFVGWQCDFDKQRTIINGNNKQFVIHKIFDFNTQNFMMSVIVSVDQKYFLYTKGTPESINQIALSKRDDLINEFNINATKGYRILGLAYRELQSNQIDLTREQLEQSLNFVGLLLMENPLKQDTADVIAALKKSGLDIKVISGDNPLTTIQCSKMAQILTADQDISFIDYNEQDQSVTIQSNNDKKVIQIQQQNIFNQLDTIIDDKSELAITGKFLDYVITQGNLKDINDLNDNQLAKASGKNMVFTEIAQIDTEDVNVKKFLFNLIKKTKVFARQKPEQKKHVIQVLQSLGKQVLMCGDGANDCSAISQAQVGISFNEADASYTAPFISRSNSIDCVIKILQQGKVSKRNFIEVFQYLISVNVIKFIAILITFLEAETFADIQFTYTSLIAIIPLLTFLCMSGPCDTLADQNPIDDQFALRNQLQIYNNLFWASVGLIINYFLSQQARDVHTCQFKEPIDNCIPKPINSLKQSGDIQSIMFLSIIFYFMTFAINLYVSSPFKLRYYQNKLLLVWTIIGFVIFFLAAIFPNQGGKWLKVIDINDNTYKGFNWIMIAVVIGTATVGFITQRLLTKFYPSQQRI